ncbi:Bud-site selection protein [Trichocladium antarcticum]|uniref:Bud-site selection protein n=1 Tax=Trichocladium antarcticum TaxID=1450529 RepID=A0AAN6ZDP2_9PEZI|nr:Bud-site selection protein [Trichocladium antarcticum]
MPKRKRDEETPAAVFARHRIDLYNALKSAKGFERQRLAKRQRDARATPDKRARIGKEIVVLKALDLQQTAHAHLCASLLRIKALAAADAEARLPPEVREGVAKPDLTEEERALVHNVTSSLYNRAEVRAVVERAVERVCAAVGVAVPERRGTGRGRRGDGEAGKKGAEVKDEGGKAVTKGETGKGKEDAAVKTKESKKDRSAQEEDGGAAAGEEETALCQLDHLLGLESSDEEDAGLVKSRTRKPTAALELDPMEITSDEEGGDEDDGELDPMEITDGEEDGDSGEQGEFEGFSDSNEGSQSSASDDEDASDAESSASSTSRPPPAKKAATKTSKTTKLKPTDSTFLPTLMGGYISGSESASDIDMAPPRKNRRGQRARQAIWEKKYKETAKHLANQAAKSRDSGWDLKRGAVDGDAGKPWKRGIRNPLDRPKGPAAAAGAMDAPPKKPAAPRVKDDSGPLHPSWEAKKLAKAKEQLTAPYQGKRITFD